MFGRSFNLRPAKGHYMLQAGVAELPYTFMLCFVILNCAASKLIVDDFKQCVRAKIIVAQGSCNGFTWTLECMKALLAAIGTLDGSCCDQLARGTDALSMPHCDEDANRLTDEAGCRLG